MVVEDWKRAAVEVERRMSERRLDRSALALLARVDRKTVDNFLDRAAKPRMSSRGGYEGALGWAWGSLTEVARGGEPEVVGTVQHMGVREAIDADPELSAEDKRALKTHYAGLLTFARQRRQYDTDTSPPGRPSVGPTGGPGSPDPALSAPPIPGSPTPSTTAASSPYRGAPEPANEH